MLVFSLVFFVVFFLCCPVIIVGIFCWAARADILSYLHVIRNSFPSFMVVITFFSTLHQRYPFCGGVTKEWRRGEGGKKKVCTSCRLLSKSVPVCLFLRGAIYSARMGWCRKGLCSIPLPSANIKCEMALYSTEFYSRRPRSAHIQCFVLLIYIHKQAVFNIVLLVHIFFSDVQLRSGFMVSRATNFSCFLVPFIDFIWTSLFHVCELELICRFGSTPFNITPNHRSPVVA